MAPYEDKKRMMRALYLIIKHEVSRAHRVQNVSSLEIIITGLSGMPSGHE